jgi:hypothetical protein
VEPPGNTEYSTTAMPIDQTQTKLVDDVLGDVQWQVHEVPALINMHNQVDRVESKYNNFTKLSERGASGLNAEVPRNRL